MENCMTRYALITGASSGIGLAMAEALARRGRSLILVARQRDQLESIAIELTQRFGVEVLFRACDLGEPLRLSGFLLELEEGDRQIDLLVNCAGIGTCGPFLAQDWMTEQDLIEVNILALTRLCHAIGNSMALQGGGQILNVASVAAFNPGPWMSTYYASKAYVLHFSEALRVELKQSAVKVSVLCPGPTRTAFFRTAQLNSDKLKDSKMLMSPEEVALYTVRALEKTAPLSFRDGAIAGSRFYRDWVRAGSTAPSSAWSIRLTARAEAPDGKTLGGFIPHEYTQASPNNGENSSGYSVHQDHQPGNPGQDHLRRRPGSGVSRHRPSGTGAFSGDPEKTGTHPQ